MAFKRGSKKPAAKAPAPSGRCCPQCGAALRTSGKGWVYCPEKYSARACQFHGYPQAQGAAQSGGPAATDIPELKTASDEQRRIFNFVEFGTLD